MKTSDQKPPRHAEVLDTAMGLIAEQGYAGASLRELARRVGVQQPSLYHYFTTKDDLVVQIIAAHEQRMFEGRGAALDAAGPFDHPRQLFLFTLEHIIKTWSTPSHIEFTRFLAAIHAYRPDLAGGLRRAFLERGLAISPPQLAAQAERWGLSHDRLLRALHMAADLLVSRFLQEKLLGISSPNDFSPRDQAEAITDMLLHGLLARGDTPVTSPKT